VHNIGEDYDAMLMAWFERFDAAWPELRALRREVLSDVEVLPGRERRIVPCPAQQLFQIVMTRRGARAPAGRRG
jgi:hypothetical protein